MICMIAALSQNNQIGLNNQMPWHIPEDLAYFRAVTTGHPILMGRKTFESIGHPLPNRRNIVLTRNQAFSPDDVEVVHTLEEAIELCQILPDIFIIGGGEIYKAFLPYADKLYLTLINKTVVGDISFPDYHKDFKCVASMPAQTLLSDNTSFSFTSWQRK